MEGVMMRGKQTMASTVRKSNGELITTTKTYIPLSKRYKILGLPFIRGAVSMIESMVVGVGALMESAEHIEFEESESKFDKWIEKKFGDKSMTIILYTSVVFALAMGIGLFMLLPNLIADFCPSARKRHQVPPRQYRGGCNPHPDIFDLCLDRVKEQGDQAGVPVSRCEHKTIYTYESMEELTVENVESTPVPSPVRHHLYFRGGDHQYTGIRTYRLARQTGQCSHKAGSSAGHCRCLL